MGVPLVEHRRGCAQTAGAILKMAGSILNMDCRTRELSVAGKRGWGRRLVWRKMS